MAEEVNIMKVTEDLIAAANAILASKTYELMVPVAVRNLARTQLGNIASAYEVGVALSVEDVCHALSCLYLLVEQLNEREQDIPVVYHIGKPTVMCEQALGKLDTTCLEMYTGGETPDDELKYIRMREGVQQSIARKLEGIGARGTSVTQVLDRALPR